MFSSGLLVPPRISLDKIALAMRWEALTWRSVALHYALSLR